jgi:hypothetical protein
MLYPDIMQNDKFKVTPTKRNKTNYYIKYIVF